MQRINPYIFPIKGDIARADAVVLYEEACRVQTPVFEFGVGASTIFLGLSGNPVIAFEHAPQWIERVRKNVVLYSQKIGEAIPVRFHSINYADPSYPQLIEAMIIQHGPKLYYIDCLTDKRGRVLDTVMANARPGDIILLHDTRSPRLHGFVTASLNKFFNRVDCCFFNLNNSNITKIVIKRETPYVNWNQEERGNHRMSWEKDDI